MKQIISLIIVILLVGLALFFGYTSYYAKKESSPATRVLINEVMASNNSFIADDDGDFSDWLELYNTGPDKVNIGGWYLSDEKGVLKWQFPEDTFIKAKGYMIVWASGKDRGQANGPCHTNFRLSSSGDRVFLYNSDGIEQSSIEFPSLASNMSYGRETERSLRASIFEKATPATTNAGGLLLEKGLEAPGFSHLGGFYKNSFSLSLRTNDPKAQIRYTLDGSEPDENSPLYTGPIKIQDRSTEEDLYTGIRTSLPGRDLGPIQTRKGTVVRARAFKDGYKASEIVTSTYFVDSKIKDRYQLPVLSLTTDPDNLFDREKGIYVPGAIFDDWKLNNPFENPGSDAPANYHQRGRAWERPVYLEYYDIAGRQLLAQNAGIRIHGGLTSAKAQKSLRLYARTDYDPLNLFAFDPFADLGGASGLATDLGYKRLVLNNAGDDWEYAGMRNSLIQGLVAHRDLATIKSSPLVVFINGEFWGIHYIQERLDRFYLEGHYGADPDKLVLLDNNGELNEGKPGDEADYFKMLDFILSHDLSVKDNYLKVKGLLDIDNYLDYFVVNTYANNVDWPHNNVRLWRYKGQDQSGETKDEDSIDQLLLDQDRADGDRIGQEKTGEDKYLIDKETDHLDGRWRFVLYDLDLGFGLGQDASFNMLDWATRRQSPETGEQWPGIIINGLLENQDFRYELINRYADHMNTSFREDVVLERIDRLANMLMPSIKDHLSRWALHGGSVASWQEEVDKLRDFAEQRPAYLKDHIMDMFGLEGTVNVRVNNTNTEGGFIRINSIDIVKATPGVGDESSFTGQYFKAVPIELTAQAMPGYKFAGWQGLDQYQDIEQIGDRLRIIPKGDIEIAASFKPLPIRKAISALFIGLLIVIGIAIIHALLNLIPIRKGKIK